MLLKAKVSENADSLLNLAEKQFYEKASHRHVCFDFYKL